MGKLKFKDFNKNFNSPKSVKDRSLVSKFNQPSRMVHFIGSGPSLKILFIYYLRSTIRVQPKRPLVFASVSSYALGSDSYFGRYEQLLSLSAHWVPNLTNGNPSRQLILKATGDKKSEVDSSMFSSGTLFSPAGTRLFNLILPLPWDRGFT